MSDPQPTTFAVTATPSDYQNILPLLPDELQNGVCHYDMEAGEIIVPLQFGSQLSAIMSEPAAQRLQAGLMAYAANARWERQVGGITVDGIPVDTSAASCNLINGAVALLANDPSTPSIDFKNGDGQWIEVARDQMVAIGVAVGTYYQQCFSAERAIDGKITAGTYVAETDIDTASEWPSTAFVPPGGAPAGS